nr:retrovirus-related Pol polyprotein from transposon TNT 1-94 [Tanacetum cinerariifolium]
MLNLLIFWILIDLKYICIRGEKCSTSASGSKHSGNIKNNRISQPSSSKTINKVEDQPRSVKTRKNKKNRVNKVKCDDHVMQSMSNANFVYVSIHNAPLKKSVNDVQSSCLCAICGKCMIAKTHYECVYVVMSKMNLSKKSKSIKKHKNQNVWKPTGNVFTDVGYKWKPIGRPFTILCDSYPLTRFTSTNVVPPKKSPFHSVEIQKPKIKVYSKKPKNVKNIGSSKMAKILESKNANHSEPNYTWGSYATDISSSSSLVMTVQEAVALRTEVLADSLVPISITQDAPSTSVGDPTLFTWHAGNNLLLVQIYVDDIIFASTNTVMCDEFANQMANKLKMSMMGKMSFFLGLQISQSPRGIFINQSKYASEIVKKYGMHTIDSVDTHMVEKIKLDEDLQGKQVDATLYHGMIRSLMYLTSSRPDLIYVVCLCARYQAKPTEKHLQAVKQIFQYLKGTINMGLWYLKDTDMSLTAYADVDHAGCQDTTRSTPGSAQFLGEKPVSWSSKKQKSTAISSTEAEYIALFGAKHIDVRYHFIKEQVENGIMDLYFIQTEYQLADIFTKALPRERFNFLIDKLDHLKQDQTMLVIKRFSERKKVLERKKTGKIRAKRMVVKEIEDELLEEMERSLDDGLSKTLVVRVKMIRRRSC